MVGHCVEDVSEHACRWEHAHRRHEYHEWQQIGVPISEIELAPEPGSCPAEVNGRQQVCPDVESLVCRPECTEHALLRRTRRTPIAGQDEYLAEVLWHLAELIKSPSIRQHYGNLFGFGRSELGRGNVTGLIKRRVKLITACCTF